MTNETARYPQLAKPVRNLKVISALMIVGCATAMGVMLFNAEWDSLKTDVKLIILLAAVSTVALLVVSHVLFSIIARHTSARSGKGSPEQSGFAVVRSAWLIRYVLLGAVFFMNLVVARLENNLIPMLIALLGLVLMLGLFPRTPKIEKALAEHLGG